LSSFKTVISALIVVAASVSIPAAQTAESVRVTTANASLRAEPKPTAAVLTSLKIGAKLELRGSEGDWYQVSTFVGSIRIQGYILKKYVTVDKPGDAANVGTASAPPKPSPAVTPKSMPTPTSKPATASPAPVAAATPSPVAGAAKTGMTASVLDAGKTVTLTPAVTRIGRMAERADSARAAAMAMPVGASTPLPTPPASLITYLWLTDDVKTAKVVTAPASFAIQFRDVPGVSADDFEPVLVSLATTPPGARVIRVIRGRVDQAARQEVDWDVVRDLKQDVVKATVQMIERGVAKLTPAAPLAPGEYAIVLRPIGARKFSGASVLSAAGEGRVFGTAWVVLVK